MQPLDKRHEDRARRKADNRAETGFVPGVSIGAVFLAMQNVATLRARLSDEDRAKLDERVEGMSAEDFLAAPSLAEAEDGNTMAGIGVVNTNVVPGDKGVRQVKPLEKSDVADDGRNANGRALDEQLGQDAWGAAGSPSSADLKGNGAGDGAGDSTEAKTDAKTSNKAGSGK